MQWTNGRLMQMKWLSEIEERLKAATPGPWEVYKDDLSDEETTAFVSTGILDIAGYQVISSDGGLFPWDGDRKSSESDANAELIAHSPADIAKLIQAVEVAEDALRDAQEHLSQYYNSMYVWSITGQALAQLQSGEFPKEDA